MVKVIDKVVPPKRKRYNKNKKKAWRKKTEIKDVEEKLEEERREERYGGPLEEREDHELMFLDFGEKSDEAVKPVTFAVDTRPGHFDGFKPSSRKRTEKPLRCHHLLKGLQGAKIIHKAKTKEDRLNAALKQKKAKLELKAKKHNLAAKEEMKLKKHTINPIKPKVAKISAKMTLDCEKDGWAVNNELVNQCKENGVDEDFVEQIVDFHSKITGERAFNVPGFRYQKTSALPAVKVPEAGQSYNPSFEDHQVVLEKAVRQEKKRIRLVAKDIRATTKMFPTIDKAPTEQTWLAEMSEGLPKAEADDDDEESDEEDEEPEATVTGKRTTERKTLKQRKKEVKKKFSERKKLLAKERRIRESSVYRIKTFKKEIIECDKMLKNRQAARKSYHEQKKSKPLRLGKLKYEAEDIAVSLGNELHGSLRLARPAVDLINERFKNLQRRNLIEPRLRFKSLKSKREKVVMKRDHKQVLAEIEKSAEVDFIKAF